MIGTCSNVEVEISNDMEVGMIGTLKVHSLNTKSNLIFQNPSAKNKFHMMLHQYDHVTFYSSKQFRFLKKKNKNRYRIYIICFSPYSLLVHCFPINHHHQAVLPKRLSDQKKVDEALQTLVLIHIQGQRSLQLQLDPSDQSMHLCCVGCDRCQ